LNELIYIGIVMLQEKGAQALRLEDLVEEEDSQKD
jgi:hypothetical protein